MNALKKTKLFPLPGISAAWNTFHRSWLLAFKIACTKRTFSCLYRNLIHSASFYNSRMLPGDSTESYTHGVTNQFGTLHCVMIKHSCFSRPLSNSSCFTFPSVEAKPCRVALYVTSLRFATGWDSGSLSFRSLWHLFRHSKLCLAHRWSEMEGKNLEA